MATIPVGTRIEYTTYTGGKVRGIVIPEKPFKDEDTNSVWMRVTSRTARYYNYGMEIPVSTTFVRVIK